MMLDIVLWCLTPFSFGIVLFVMMKDSLTSPLFSKSESWIRVFEGIERV